MKTESDHWYLSFADEDGFRGGIIVEANDMTEALAESWLRNINPGGSVSGLRIPPEELWRVPPQDRNRLLTKQECLAIDQKQRP